MRIERKIRGFTLIELLIVLGVVAVIGAGMYAVYNNVMVAQKSNQEIDNLNVLKMGIENLYASSGKGYGSAPMTEMIAASSIPTNSMKKGGTKITIVNPWGNEYEIKGEDTTFSLKTKMPKTACEKVVPVALNSWGAAAVNGGSSILTKSSDVTDILADCLNADGDDVDIAFIANYSDVPN